VIGEDSDFKFKMDSDAQAVTIPATRRGGIDGSPLHFKFCFELPVKYLLDTMC
jgi:hypothetical protein